MANLLSHACPGRTIWVTHTRIIIIVLIAAYWMKIQSIDGGCDGLSTNELAWAWVLQFDNHRFDSTGSGCLPCVQLREKCRRENKLTMTSSESLSSSLSETSMSSESWGMIAFIGPDGPGAGTKLTIVTFSSLSRLVSERTMSRSSWKGSKGLLPVAWAGGAIEISMVWSCSALRRVVEPIKKHTTGPCKAGTKVNRAVCDWSVRLGGEYDFVYISWVSLLCHASGVTSVSEEDLKKTRKKTMC